MSEEPDQYRAMSLEFVIEVGKLTMARSALEETVYKFAEEIAFDSASDKPIRRMTGTVAAERFRERILSVGLPPWSGGDVTARSIAEWASQAKGAMTESHTIVHSHSFAMWSGNALVPKRTQTGKQLDTPTEATTLKKMRVRMDDLEERGLNLMLGILPLMAPKMYLSFYGSTASSYRTYEDGAWPDWPASPDDQESLIARHLTFWSAFLNGGFHEVRNVESLQGTRVVPPFFGDLTVPS